MDIRDIGNLRLVSQHVSVNKFKTAGELLGWMGALQAQDYAMAKWALGVRLPGTTEKSIEAAFNRGEFLRTHVLRPTWHMVTAQDIRWMLELTAPQIRSAVRARNKELGISEAFLEKTYDILKIFFSSGKHLSKADLLDLFTLEKIKLDSAQLYHLLLNAELDGILCSGRIKEKEQTYAIFAERALSSRNKTRDKALAELATRYFASHGPATIHDFAWWSGLSLTDSRTAVALSEKNIASEKIGSQTYWFSPTLSAIKNEKDAVYLLPAFDEFIISYKDRRHILLEHDQAKAISSNGVFRPVIVVNGLVVGLWSRTTKKNTFIIELKPFVQLNKNVRHEIENKAAGYGVFF